MEISTDRMWRLGESRGCVTQASTVSTGGNLLLLLQFTCYNGIMASAKPGQLSVTPPLMSDERSQISRVGGEFIFIYVIFHCVVPWLENA